MFYLLMVLSLLCVAGGLFLVFKGAVSVWRQYHG